jgi:hypothetical protein
MQCNCELLAIRVIDHLLKCLPVLHLYFHCLCCCEIIGVDSRHVYFNHALALFLHLAFEKNTGVVIAVCVSAGALGSVRVPHNQSTSLRASPSFLPRHSHSSNATDARRHAWSVDARDTPGVGRKTTSPSVKARGRLDAHLS